MPLSVLVVPVAALPSSLPTLAQPGTSDTSGFPVDRVEIGPINCVVWERDIQLGVEHLRNTASCEFRLSSLKVNYVEDGDVQEPVLTISVHTPEDYLGDILGDLNGRRGFPLGSEDSSEGKVVAANVPLAKLIGYERDLSALTSSRATVQAEFHSYQIMPRTDPPPKEPGSGALKAQNPSRFRFYQEPGVRLTSVRIKAADLVRPGDRASPDSARIMR